MRLWPVMLPLLVAGGSPCGAGARWALQFFHDALDSELVITDLAFPSPRTGVAAGYLLERGRTRPRVLLTRDGGRSWQFVETREAAVALHFLDENLGWMVTERGLWRSGDGGATWSKLSGLRGLLRVHFLDSRRGFAVGLRKAIYETADGGVSWTRLAAADQPDSNPERTVYGWIEFAGPKVGSIVGWSSPRREPEARLPDWLDPEGAETRRQWPTFSIVLQTSDGGRSWQHSTTSMFGRITRLRRLPDGRGLALVEFQDTFEWPAEVFRIDLRENRTERAYREKNRAVTDLAFAGDRAYLAAIEPPGKLRQTPVPGRLVMIRSSNLKDWEEMEVDYRAFGRRAVLAVGGDREVWVATDTGMILRLEGQ